MINMFSSCFSLTSIDLLYFKTSSVTNMFNMLFNCTSLVSLNLSNFDTSNVQDMSSMFRNCSRLTELDLSNFKYLYLTGQKRDSSLLKYAWLIQKKRTNIPIVGISNFNITKFLLSFPEYRGVSLDPPVHSNLKFLL